MGAQATENPFQTFVDPRTGQALSDGYVYFGEPDLDPTTNPIDVYWDEDLTIPAQQPLRTNAGYIWRNGAPARAWVDGNYSTLVQDRQHRQVFYAPDWTAGNAANIAFRQAGAGAVLRDARSKMREQVTVLDFIPPGTNTATVDVVTYIQAALVAIPNSDVWLLPGTYKISDQLEVPAGTSFMGCGIGVSILACTTDMTSVDAAVLGAGDDIRVLNMSIHGNRNGIGSGGGFGVWLSAGARCVVDHVYVKETTQAGIRLHAQENCRVRNCITQDTGISGYTDDHGIMLYTFAPGEICYDVIIENCVVDSPSRKGIATAALGTGTIYNCKVLGCTVYNAGLGGIFLNGASVTPADNPTVSTGFVVSDNRISSSNTGIEFACMHGITVTGNNIIDSITRGILLNDNVIGATITGNTIDQVGTIGISVEQQSLLLPCKGLTITGNTIRDSNRTTAGYAPGISLYYVTDSVIANNTIYDPTSALVTHGIYENTGCDRNVIVGNKLRNATSGIDIFVTGNNTTAHNLKDGNTRIGGTGDISAAQNTLQIGGGLTLKEQAITLAATDNNNVALPAGAAQLAATGAAAPYNLTGIAGGHAGRRLTLINNTAQTLNLIHNSGLSSAGNKLILAGSVDAAIASFGVVELVYSSIAGAWMRLY